jgi:hypothetical protein
MSLEEKFGGITGDFDSRAGFRVPITADLAFKGHDAWASHSV